MTEPILTDREILMLNGALLMIVGLRGTDEEVLMAEEEDPGDLDRLQEKYGMEAVVTVRRTRDMAAAPFN